MSSPNNSGNKELKRVPIACLRCRHKKLKCRPSDQEGKCIRCAEANSDCKYVPVPSAAASSNTEMVLPVQQGHVNPYPPGIPAASYYNPQPISPYNNAMVPWPMQSSGPPIDPSLMQNVYTRPGPAPVPSHPPQQLPYTTYSPAQQGLAVAAQHPSSPHYGAYPVAWPAPVYYDQASQSGGHATGARIASGAAQPPSYSMYYGTSQPLPPNWTPPASGHHVFYPNSTSENTTDTPRNYLPDQSGGQHNGSTDSKE